jgi:hypothetical protein
MKDPRIEHHIQKYGNPRPGAVKKKSKRVKDPLSDTHTFTTEQLKGVNFRNPPDIVEDPTA